MLGVPVLFTLGDNFVQDYKPDSAVTYELIR